MCGICGIYSLDGSSPDREAVLGMRALLSHRGPDDEGEHFDGPVGLGFRRLSILDLEGGHQPMATADGRVTMVFNGEIYNHPELRRELEAGGTRFRTHSDTETILELYAREGVSAFGRLNGMFAVGLWDRGRKEFILARDPVGIKPVYYSFDGKRLAFASELRALLASGAGEDLDPAGVLDYLAYGLVHAPRTIFKNILKLPPGTVLRLNAQGLRLERFWRLPRRKPESRLSLAESVEELDGILSEAVQGAMLSDVPVGAFLSGGVDSSLVVAYMARASARKMQTFSVGFSGAASGVDESGYARQAAAHLGTDHHELILPAGVLERFEESVGVLDEPIADSAILPTYLLSKFAARSVKVVLSGEGSDELFGGYDRYKAAWVNQGLKGLPPWGRRWAAPLARRLGKGAVFDRLPIEDARAWAAATAHAGPQAVRAVLDPGFLESSRHADPLEWLKEFESMDHLNEALAFDLETVLADALLMKVDKSTMRASLEARVPFLNKPVVEYAARLPSSLKIRRFKGKYLLRLVAQKYLPRGLAWRRKHGFVVPWEAWVRDPDSASIRGLLDSASFRSRGLFDVERLRRVHAELARGSREADAGLFFRVAVLGLWLESLASRHV